MRSIMSNQLKNLQDNGMKSKTNEIKCEWNQMEVYSNHDYDCVTSWTTNLVISDTNSLSFLILSLSLFFFSSLSLF